MKKSSNIFWASILAACFLSHTAYAAVTKLAITTPEQSVAPNSVSEAITIQTQDSSGSPEQTSETLDLEFNSSSATGEFLNSVGNPATKTMSVGTANRTFYYRDSSEGNFTISVKAIGRTSGENWSASQQILVGGSGTAQRSADTQTQSGQIAQSTSVGATSKVSSPNSSIDLYPLSDRSTAVGSILEFQAVIKKNSAPGKLEFDWSLGDGNVASGQTVSHIYKYPGEYAVVLNTRSNEVYSINRFKVKVSRVDIELKNDIDFIEVQNNGSSEINLFNWKLESDGRGFVFQPDTIIMPKMAIAIEKKLLSMHGFDISHDTILKNALGEIEVNLNESGVALLEANEKLEDAKIQLSNLREQPVSVGFVAPKEITTTSVQPILEDAKTASSSPEVILYEAPKSENIFSKLTNLVKRVFSR